MTTTTALEMKNICFSYGDKSILNDFNLKISEGKTVCLVGSSGSGKTTTLKLMNGLLRPKSGEVFIDGQNFKSKRGESWRRSMGYSIQGSGLFPHLNLKENLTIIAKKEGLTKQQQMQRIEELFGLMSLPFNETFLKKKPRQISGGQQQRIGLARALFMNPKIMLMDEPFSALDPITRNDIQAEFVELQSKLNLTIILVTHDLSEAFRMGDELVLLNQGQVEQQGRPSKFLLNPASDYVDEFIHSHSPGNRLKEVYLYSVLNNNIWVSEKTTSGFKLVNLDSEIEQQLNSKDELEAFLDKHQQTSIYWVDQQGNFLYNEYLEGNQSERSLNSRENILVGMKALLDSHLTALPVVNNNGKLVGVFSQEALDAL